ncbi:MAG: UTP--glucose-1-phosphate uridylyltransferase [Chloroflexi bacterium]|nr:UTP--glucose-1-phosphate uridylyltransferase [Chloroflexota bacterium]
MKVRKAVIPAAGLGTRFLPVTKSVPKELLPILDRPMLQYVVEEAVEAGIEDIIIVTSRGKESIAAYFQPRPELESRLLETGAIEMAQMVKYVSNLADVSFVIQEEPLGLGHAILTAMEAVGNEPFVVILPDDIIDYRPGATSQVLKIAQGYGCGAIAVEQVPWDIIHNYGVVAVEKSDQARTYRVRQLVEKPPMAEAPSNLSIVGRYVLPPDIFECLQNTPPGAKGEIQLTDGIGLLLESRDVYAYEFVGTRYDGGTPLGLLRASLEFGLARNDTAQAVQTLINSLATG